MTPSITIDRDFVVVQDTVVRRLPSISPSQWLDFWDVDKDRNVDELETKIEDLEDSNKDLEKELEAIQEERDNALADVKILQDKIDAAESALR